MILQECDEGEFQKKRSANEENSRVLCIAMRKIDRIEKRFAKLGMDKTMNILKGSPIYTKKADGDFEAHPAATVPPDIYPEVTAK